MSSCGSGDRVIQRIGRVSIYFELLADSASFDVVLDEGSHSWPPIIFFNGVKGFDFSRMSCGDDVVIFGCDLSSKFLIFRNVVLPLQP